MSSKLSIAYDSIRSRDKAIEDLEEQIGALESDKYEALYFYEQAMKGREEWQGKAFAAEAEVAALRAWVAELETLLTRTGWVGWSTPPQHGQRVQAYAIVSGDYDADDEILILEPTGELAIELWRPARGNGEIGES